MLDRRWRWIPAVTLLFHPVITQAAPAEPVAPGPWKYGAVAGLNLSQSSFSANWAGGDRGSIVWVLNSDVTAERQFNPRFNSSNVLQLAYGQTSRQTFDPATRQLTWDTPDKTTDQIAFESVGRFTLGSFADPYFSLRLDSQFNDQSSPFGDLRFNPIKLKESAGIARVLRKTEDSETITRLGLGFRQTLATSFVPSTLEKRRFTSNDGGVEWQTSVTQPVLEKKVLYKGQLLVFLPVFYSSSDELEDFDRRVREGELPILADPSHENVGGFWKAPDVNFQNTFTAGITKYLSVNLTAQLIYDKFDSAANVDPDGDLGDQIAEIGKNVRKAGQFKQTLAVGLTYRMF